MSEWQRFENETRAPKANSGSGISLFVKLNDGDSITGVLVGNPHVYYAMWENGKKLESDTKQPGYKFRFKINLVREVNGAFVAQILDNGKLLYDDIVALHESGYNLEETMVRISRTGTGTSTRYNVVPSPQPLSAEVLEQVRATKLKRLTPQDKEETTEDIPF